MGRIEGLTVVLDDSVEEGYANRLMMAIGLLKGVVTVVANVADASDYINMNKVRKEFRDKFVEWIIR